MHIHTYIHEINIKHKIVFCLLIEYIVCLCSFFFYTRKKRALFNNLLRIYSLICTRMVVHTRGRGGWLDYSFFSRFFVLIFNRYSKCLPKDLAYSASFVRNFDRLDCNVRENNWAPTFSFYPSMNTST